MLLPPFRADFLWKTDVLHFTLSIVHCELLNHKSHIFHPTAMFRAGGNDINAGCVDTAVPENIGKLGDVLLNTVKHSCKQVPKIMRKHFVRVYICFFAQCFHFSPNVCTAHRLSVFRHKNRTRLYSLLCCIAEQFLLALCQ